MMKAKELRKSPPAELKRELSELLRELFNLRMQKGTGQAVKPHAFKKARRGIARIKTLLNEEANAS